MRTFLALALPDPAIEALSALQDRLPVGHHVDPDDLHVTLAFLGDAPRDVLDEIDMALSVLRVPPPRIEIRGLDTFGSDPPRLVHVAVLPDPALLHLQRKVARVARTAGADLPRSRFVPHVTLARFGRGIGPDDLARLGRFLQAHGDFRLDPFPVEAVGLYRSHRTGNGNTYDLLETYPV